MDASVLAPTATGASSTINTTMEESTESAPAYAEVYGGGEEPNDETFRDDMDEDELEAWSHLLQNPSPHVLLYKEGLERYEAAKARLEAAFKDWDRIFEHESFQIFLQASLSYDYDELTNLIIDNAKKRLELSDQLDQAQQAWSNKYEALQRKVWNVLPNDDSMADMIEGNDVQPSNEIDESKDREAEYEGDEDPDWEAIVEADPSTHEHVSKLLEGRDRLMNLQNFSSSLQAELPMLEDALDTSELRLYLVSNWLHRRHLQQLLEDKRRSTETFFAQLMEKLE